MTVSTSTSLLSETLKLRLPPSVTDASPIDSVAASSFRIVPMPVNVVAAPENCTLRPLALKADSTNRNCSSSSTLLSPLIVTFTV